MFAVGARYNDPSSSANAGHVWVYKFNGTGWTQLALDIDGEASDDWSGSLVSLSSNGSVLSIGAHSNDPTGSCINARPVQVYKFNGTGWTQLGLNIDGESAGDGSGHSVSLSSDDSVLIVGALGNDPSCGFDAGNVRVYQFNSIGWNELSLDIDGEAAQYESGWSVSLSNNGSVLAVGVRYNDPTSDGHVRV